MRFDSVPDSCVRWRASRAVPLMLRLGVVGGVLSHCWRRRVAAVSEESELDQLVMVSAAVNAPAETRKEENNNEESFIGRESSERKGGWPFPARRQERAGYEEPLQA